MRTLVCSSLICAYLGGVSGERPRQRRCQGGVRWGSALAGGLQGGNPAGRQGGPWSGGPRGGGCRARGRRGSDADGAGGAGRGGVRCSGAPAARVCALAAGACGARLIGRRWRRWGAERDRAGEAPHRPQENVRLLQALAALAYLTETHPVITDATPR